MNRDERDKLIKQYEDGPRQLAAAWARVPEEARQWRPGPGKWSAHEVVCHAADSETNAAGRVRYVLAEKEPLIMGYDQDEWARTLDYHALPIEWALATIGAVRGWTTALLRRLPESAWTKKGRHSEKPGEDYTPQRWLEIYAAHLAGHARQIERNLAAWEAAHGARTAARDAGTVAGAAKKKR